MNTRILAVAIAALGAQAGLAMAQQSYGDTARVLSSTPISERVTEQRRECRVEQVNGYVERRETTGGSTGAGAVVGAIVGGVIGHQFGSGAGRDHGSVAGAVVGGLVGNQVEKDNNGPPATYVDRQPVARDVERCRFVPETRDRVVGYDVRYEYNGREFMTRLAYDPGPEMPVNVDVRPPAGPRPAWGGPAAPTYR